MPRLFTGLEIPVAWVDDLSMLRGGLPGARWIDPENYHMTLRFIGDVDDALAREIASLLGQVRRRGFEWRLRRAGVVRRPQAARGGGAALAPIAGADGVAGRARAPDAARRPGAGGAQVHAARHAGAAARFIEPRRSPTILRPARAFALAAVSGVAIRAVLLARLGRRRALCGRGGLSADHLKHACCASNHAEA